MSPIGERQLKRNEATSGMNFVAKNEQRVYRLIEKEASWTVERLKS